MRRRRFSLILPTQGRKRWRRPSIRVVRELQAVEEARILFLGESKLKTREKIIKFDNCNACQLKSVP